ncbi:hypothetical protein SHIRM173S_11409 [Streptomyces hirsutus]
MTDQLKWFKSSYSDNEGGNCVEVALAPTIHIRDSKVILQRSQLRVLRRRLVGVDRRSSARSLSPGIRALPMGFLGFLVWLKYPTNQV